jgi:GNAT superfamily N-acetyltransferase
VTGELVLREARADDRPKILALAARTLGWVKNARHEALFAWKHDHNVFGRSPAWVVMDDDRLAGFRTFLCWEFELDGEVIRAARAVDTATDRAYQRRGVFRRLTLHALEELQADGARFVFNTPNEQSRPGYLNMGWQVVGRISLAARPAGLHGFVRMANARAPAELWSVESVSGEPATAVLEDHRPINELLRSQPHSHSIVTRRSVEYLRWRYGFPPLSYRAAVMHGDVAAGLALYRVRRRGGAREAALCETLVPEGDRATGRRLVREVARTSGADYVLRVAGPGDGCGPLPGQGPTLTWRSLCDWPRPRRHDWGLTLGDVELL